MFALRVNIKFCIKLCMENLIPSHRMHEQVYYVICAVYDDAVIRGNAVLNWYIQFQDGPNYQDRSSELLMSNND